MVPWQRHREVIANILCDRLAGQSRRAIEAARYERDRVNLPLSQYLWSFFPVGVWCGSQRVQNCCDAGSDCCDAGGDCCGAGSGCCDDSGDCCDDSGDCCAAGSDCCG